MRTYHVGWVTLTIALAACSSSDSSSVRGAGEGGNVASGGGRAGSGAAGAGGSGGPVDDVLAAPCPNQETFRAPLRRLTRDEYNRTVRDLLGDTTAPANGFPVDELSNGFSNDAAVLSVSPLFAEKAQAAAEALAANAVKDLPRLTGCDAVKLGEQPCARQFVEGFGRRAYRRPLNATETDRLLGIYAAAREGATFARGIEVTLQAMLQSPHFLYRVEGATSAAASDKLVRLTDYEIATRLSYLLWGTMPDAGLFAAAERGELRDAKTVAATARTMLADPRARPAISEFFRQWLGVARLPRATKDSAAYPQFTPELRDAMAAETSSFVEDLMWQGDGKLATLLTSSRGFVTSPLASLYGVSAATGGRSVDLPAAERAGVLTHAGVLAVHALPDQSSPILRGKFVREQVLCQPMPAQPPGLMVTPPEVDPNRSTRERFAAHVEETSCSVCHRLMDPIGFGFEAYDGIGAHRARDGGGAIDDRGELVDTDVDGAFQGAPALARKLAGSAGVRACVSRQWYRFAFGRHEGPGDACSLQRAHRAFADAGDDLRELVLALTETDAFLQRPAHENEVAP